ncbi:MAG: D-glycerate dehydrogenase, partial [Mycetocola sp.]
GAGKIAVLRALPGSASRLLADSGATVVTSPLDRPLNRDELHVMVAGASGIVATLTDHIDGSVVAAAGGTLQVVANVAAGYDNIDVSALNAAGVTVTNTPDVLTAATADFTLALILAATRRLIEADQLVRSGVLWEWSPSFLVGNGLEGKRLGIVGLGNIGQAVAHRARAFGMEIVHSSRRHQREPGSKLVSFEELLQTSDVITLHCPLTSATRHLIGEQAIAQMKAGVCLINTGRGQLIDEDALTRALEEGRIGSAGLDVFENEPRIDARLRALPNVVLAPHIGSATSEARSAMADLAAKNVMAVLRGEEPLTPVRNDAQGHR